MKKTPSIEDKELQDWSQFSLQSAFNGVEPAAFVDKKVFGPRKRPCKRRRKDYDKLAQVEQDLWSYEHGHCTF